MPGVQKTELYMAKSIGELNKYADLQSKQISTNNPKLLLRSAEKIIKEAEAQDLLGDEEKAYVLYMKYFNVITIIKKTVDYKKQKEYYDSLIGKKNVLKAITKAEELSSNIRERYDLMEAKLVADKLASIDNSNGNSKILDQDVEPHTAVTSKDKGNKSEQKKEEKSKEASQSTGEITCTQLHALLNDKDVEIAIMDVRPVDQYKSSHIKHSSCINIPADIIPAGTTITYIEKSLPDESKSLWKQRGNLDHIILLDWNSTQDKVNIGTTLRTLKDALFKYDSTVIIKSEPLVLEGGYDQWLLYYPQLTTNAMVERPSYGDTVSPIPSLDFDYPDFDEAFIKTPKSTPNQNESELQINKSEPSSQNVNIMDQSNVIKNLNGPMNGSVTGIPKIDRTSKPKPVQKPVDSQAASGLKSGLSDRVDSFISLYPSVSLANKGNLTSDDLKLDGDSARLMSSSAMSNYSDELEKERQELEKIRKQKEEELANFQKEKEKISLEHQARIEKLRMEEKKMEKLDKLRQEQTKDVAELMRMKKRLQDEIQQETKKNEDEERKKELEEMERKKELRIMIEKERQRREEVERLRMERKIKEENLKKEELEMLERDKAEKEALGRARERAKIEEENRQREVKLAEEKAEKLRQEEIKRNEEARRRKEQEEEETRRVEQASLDEQRKLQEEQKRKDLEQKKQQEIELKKQQEAEKKRLQEIEQKRQLELKEKQERDRQVAERREREKKEQEQAERAKAEQAQKEAEEKLRRINEERRIRTIPSPNLPTGWEKRLDPATRRYYYINHRAGTTQWEPPETTSQSSTSAHQMATYTAKLKDEPTEPKRGLARSHSSPNIAKLIEDEEKERQLKTPSIDRSKKPEQRIENIPEILRPSPQKQAQRFRNLNPVFGSVGRALTGLRNLGNTCYMNSIIQCLNHTSPLVTYFITDAYLYDVNRESELGCHGEVAEEFAVIVKALWSGSYRCITPRDFKWMVGKHQPMFAGHEQQDSQEFLTFLLDGLHESLNKVKTRPKIPEQENDNIPDSQASDIAWKHHKLLNESIIVELFQGQLKSTLMCLTCRKQSVTFQAFMYLSLPIPSGSRCTLQECLRQFLKEEKMTGSSRWRCPRCKKDRDSVKKIDIWKLPRLLLIGLNRFVYEGQWREKINSYVDFPVKSLDLNPYILGPKNSRMTYNLYGISNHYGTMDGGHYTAYCRNPCSQRWYKFDDNDVYEMSSSDIKTSAAFVLFYTSIELTPPALPQLF